MTDTSSPQDLRDRLVDRIVKERIAGLHDPRVEAAMRTVPRHEFIPQAPLETAYANQAVTIKDNPDPDTLPLSCVSQPDVVFFMLAQLDIQPGHDILEAGAGTGYNAALMQLLTGPDGKVTTLDVHEDVVAHARQRLTAAGFGDVRVLARDAALGAPEFAPYDRIIATVGVWDLPATWWDQLPVGGRLVLPLRWRGLTRSVAFVREADRLRSESLATCGFLPMIGQDGEREDYVDEHRLVKLYWDADQPIQPTDLRHNLTADRAHVAWMDVSVAPDEPLDGIWLRLSATDPATCRLTVRPAAFAEGTGLHRPAIPALTPALAETDSLAYLILEPIDQDGSRRYRLGAAGYGPDARNLAERLTTRLRAWDTARSIQPSITAYPAGTPDSRLAHGHVIDKPSVRLVITY
ncbi:MULTISPECIES: methyltransferase, FxLD system [Streptomyces]|uniref:Protein-L-isoaspartate O-methyltransferase n=2 Tax=Streptomyces sudanensis TaxID=436397 RepID=A0ABY4T835_9ACTN|nr:MULTISPECIES: methyltransferase, FxLD system [Streptomyces]MCP9986565.1 methyltransferase, FxLD system [Streptomyces sudanensis]URN15124.1 methyltransferase, FxLD system [Streptomyces sudanensis]